MRFSALLTCGIAVVGVVVGRGEGAEGVREAWVATYDGGAGSIVVDEKGFVYVAGSSKRKSESDDSDPIIIKYDPDGNEVWVARYDLDNDLPEGPTSQGAGYLALDRHGSLFVTGQSDRDYLTLKFDPDGRNLEGLRHGKV